jgi:hypothetical protein
MWSGNSLWLREFRRACPLPFLRHVQLLPAASTRSTGAGAAPTVSDARSPPMRLSRSRLSALATCLTTVLASCDAVEPSEYVNQNRIWTDYELRYDGSRDLTIASSTFRFGGSTGTLLELSGGSEVRVNGWSMSKVVQPLTNLTYYERAFAGRLTSGTFLFVDTEGTAYQNTIAPRFIDFPGGTLGPLDNDASYEMFWEGPALGVGEEVQLVVYRLEGGVDLAVFHQREYGARSIILDRGQLQHVEPGVARLSLQRTVFGVPAERTDAGGRIRATYSAPDVAVHVVE